MRWLLWLILVCGVFHPPPRAFAAPEDEPPPAYSQESVPVEALGEVPEASREITPESTRVLYLRTRGGTTYVFPDDPTDPEHATLYESLSPEQREAFRANRMRILGRAVTLLNLGRWPSAGIHSLKDRVSWLFGHWFWNNPSGTPAGERGRRAIQSTLRGLDSLLWASAPVLAEPNEMGVTLIVGGGGVAMADRFGGGLFTDFMLAATIGRGRTVALELMQDGERTRRAFGIAGGIGVYVGILFTVNNYNWDRPRGVEIAETLAGPSFGPVFLMGSSSPSSLRVGLAAGPGLHLPVVSDVTVSHGRSHRVPWVRIGLSPNWLGLVRVRGLVGGILNTPFRMVASFARVCGSFFSDFAPPDYVDGRWYGN